MADANGLLRRCHPYLVRELSSYIECVSTLRMDDDGEIRPVPGTLETQDTVYVRDLVGLIREIECEAGSTSRSLQPDWVEDVIEGRDGWSELVGLI